MAKVKRGKSGSASGVKWESELVQAPFAENDWNALVVFVAPNAYTDKDVVSVLTETIKSGLRKLYSVIDYEQLLLEVKDITAQNKASKGKPLAGKAPQFVEICDHVKTLMDQGDSISVYVLAKLVKFKLLLIKNKDIERREMEIKSASSNSKLQGVRSPTKTGSPTRAKSQSSGKGGKKGAKKEEKLPPPLKKDTKLKKRGEEDEVFMTIDDEPDGPTDPQHYIIMTGFTDAALLSTLPDIKVVPNALIKLKTDYHMKLDEKNKSIASDESEEVSPEEEEQIRTLQLAQEESQEILKAFWENSDLLLKHAPTGHPLRNVAKFDVVIKEECLPEQLLDSISKEIKTEFGTWLFEKVADVCYDMLDYLQQYKRYMEHLKIVDVSAYGSKQQNIDQRFSSPSDANNDVFGINSGNFIAMESYVTPPPCDLRYYDKLMSNVPVESESVPLILDCLLEQIVAITDGPNPADISPPPRPDGLNHLVGDYLDKQLAIYGMNETKKIWKSEQKSPSTPKIVYYGDEKRSKLLNVLTCKEFDAQKMEDRMRGFHPYTYFMSYLQPPDDEWMENCIRRIQLYNFCKNKSLISEEKFERAMRQYIFESLPLEIAMDCGTTGGDTVEEQLEKIVSRWDDPYVDMQQVISEPNVGKSLSEEFVETSFSLRQLDHYNWLERLEPSVLFQILDNGSDLRPYLDTYYNRGNNTLLVVLHNPANENMQNNFTWESWLHSNVGFQNYLEHVAMEIQEWTVEQERLEEESKEKQLPQQTESLSPLPIPVKERSRWEMKTRAELAEENAANKEGEKTKKSGSKNKRDSPKKRASKSPDKKKPEAKTGKTSGKRSRQTTATKRPNSHKSNVSFSEVNEKSRTSQVSTREYAFTGYNLGDMLLHLSIDHSYLFPRNGALVKIEKLSYIDQDNCVQVTLMYKGDTFAVNFLNPVPLPNNNDVVTRVLLENTEVIPSAKTISEFEEKEKSNKTHQPSQQASPSKDEQDLPSLPHVQPAICQYSSVTGTFADGMIIAFSSSTKRQQQSEENLKVAKILSTISKESPEGVSNISSSLVPKSPKGKKVRKDDEARQQEENERFQREASSAKRLLDRHMEILEILKKQQSAKNLYVTSPNGIHLSFKHGMVVEASNKGCSTHTFVLKQQLFSNAREEVTLENHDVVKELYRCITENGLVLKFNSDDTVEILSRHGDIYHSSPFPNPPPQPPAGVKCETTIAPVMSPTANRPASKKGKHPKGQPVTEQPAVVNGNKEGDDAVEWRVLSGRGEQWIIRKDKTEEFLDELLVSDVTCYDTNQILQTREDGVMILLRPDGSKIVEYLDGTRITTREEIRTEDVVNEETGEMEGTRECTCQLITIEHKTYPTTIVDLSESSINVVYSNGKSIQAFKHGGYVISKEKMKQVVVNSNGEISIYPEDIGSRGQSICILKESLIDCLHVIDDVGNVFRVNANGDYTVHKVEESSGQESTAASITPRYFVVYLDGSGEELLRYEDVREYLREAEKDESSALIHAPVEGDEEATAVTVIKPHEGQPSQIWKTKKREANIIPVGLRERDFKTFPTEERKTPAPKYSSIFGGTIDKPASRAIPSCPELLEIRHLINYKELTNDVRKDIIDGINKYGDYVQKQQDEQKRVKGLDERNAEEKTAALKIREKFLRRENTDPVNDLVADATNQAAEEILAEQYMHAVTPLSPPPPRRAQPERPTSEWEKDKMELQELQHAKSVICNKDFPSYFKTEEGQSFLYKSSIYPDMRELTNRLAEEAKHPPERSPSICSSSSDHMKEITPTMPVWSSTPQVEDSSFCMDMSSSLSMKCDFSSNSISPYVSSGNTSSSVGIGRPLNPTPQKAETKTSSNHAIAETKLQTIDEMKTACVSDDREAIGNNSLLYDVTGSPRKEQVKTPVSILGSRPNALPNEKFAFVEEPVRRQIKTMSVYGSVDADMTSKLRGFILLPDLVDFGVLREGSTYTYSVVLKNVGVDTCRFKIKQPPPSTGLKVVYQPRAVAAGMEVRIEMEIFAMAVGVEGNNGIGKISHHVEITTETDIMFLPVIATVITQHEFDDPSERTPRGGPSKGTFVLNDRPSSRETLTRPRKDYSM